MGEFQETIFGQAIPDSHKYNEHNLYGMAVEGKND